MSERIDRLWKWLIARWWGHWLIAGFFLAGGLRPENVGEAIDLVGPFGLDLCTSVRTDGRLDERKLARFFDAVAAAGRAGA